MRHLTSALLAVALCSVTLVGAACRRSTIPAALNDHEFWSLIEALSEPAGTFTHSANLVSNEPHFPEVVRRLTPSRGAYIGVGPEQNFTYVAALRPAIAFIIDIRRENLSLHLLYKALFEMSADRVDFVSRLFSRPTPRGLTAAASVDEIFDQFEHAPISPQHYDRTLALVRDRLMVTHKLPVSQEDLYWIEHVLKTFYTDGPRIDYYGSRSLETVRPSYRQLMTAKDFDGRSRSFLGSEGSFAFVKDLQSRNMIVPVVGDFGAVGTNGAMRRVGEYVRAHHDRIHAVYGSNVAVYLTNQQAFAFCENLGTLPAASRAWFIDGVGMRSLDSRLRACVAETK